MKTNINKNYPFCVWLTTIGVTPILFLIYAITQDGLRYFSQDVSMVPLFLIFGFLFSLPTYIAYFICFNFLIPKISSVLLAKAILTLVALAGIIITFWIIDGYIVVAMGSTYSASVILTGVMYRLTKRSGY